MLRPVLTSHGSLGGRYAKTLTLSLYFFNLLPLPLLDGGQLLDALGDWWGLRRERARRAGDVEMEDVLERGEGEVAVPDRAVAGRRTRGRWKRVVHVSVGVLLGACVLLGLIDAFRQ